MKKEYKIEEWMDMVDEVGGMDTTKVRSNRLEDNLKMKEFDLPIAVEVTGSLEDFIRRPNYYFESIHTDKYYMLLNPKSKDVKRISVPNITADEVREHVKNVKDVSKYDFHLKDFEENVYGGSLRINDESVIIEMKEGTQTGVAQGTVHPDELYVGIGSPKGHAMKYNTGDEFIRRLMWRTLQEFRSRGEGYDFMNCYAEFAWTKWEGRSNLRLRFIDFKTKEGYIK